VGKLSCTLKGYEPCHNAEEVIAEFDYNPDSDTDNTCDSVFCSKGAGYNVKWDEVKSHMHLPSILSTPKSEYAPTRSAGRMSSYADKNDLFALDKELMEIFEQTYGKIKHKNPNNSHFTFTEKTEKQNPKRMPKAPKYEGPEYLLVDGYNVIFSWDNLKKLADSSIDGARNALINILCNYQGYKRCEVIVVFDAYKVKGNHREIEKVNNITVVYTKEAETADMYIEKASLDLAKKHKVRVVTSDALEQVIILGNGALRVSSCEFQGEVKSAEENIRTIIENNH
ncbi:MAG: NYN domain-containing protein, partial [Eubacterium coprostanoligenes]|nr:NYN domain-containing protein [Eubacterium coprostanoligenes]